ncbi:Vitamin K-dependent gamma-carboxylase [Flavobacteriaceae bacterium Ap0902]|nr:Vitamin K-dependent gamma-carboxylase [Flavobacteriaceae bacterium Ap0902]
MNNYLFEKVDNSKLVFFRIFFGLLMMVECWGAIVTGWVKETFVDPQFTFNFIGFDWTQVFVGETMYYLYGFMGFMGLLIMLGAFYRAAIISFFLCWSLTYFMQKSHYNNHYYLIMLVSFLLMFMPANRYLSLDEKIFSGLKSTVTEKWNYLLFKVLIACVYIFAAIAKISPGWLGNHFLPLRLNYSAQWFENQFGANIFSDFLRNPELAGFLSYSGIIFDFLIVPLLLFKPTRRIAFILGIMFHLFNSITLHIGIFPYFALAMCIFFFDSRTINKIFFPFKQSTNLNERHTSLRYQQMVKLLVAGFICIQLYLPIRHWLIPGDVLWTEEGHRMAWRMMLRTKAGNGSFVVEYPDHSTTRINLHQYLTRNQLHSCKAKPDMIWQFAQILKRKMKEERNLDVKVFYKNGVLKINDGPWYPYIDPETDLAHTKWSYFGHQEWILPEPDDYYAKK